MFWWIKKVHFAIWNQSLLISRMAGYQELYRLRQTITGSQKHWLSFISDKCVFNQFYFHPVHKVSQERLPWGQGGGEGGGGRCGGGESQDLHWLWQASEVHPVSEDCLSKVWKLDLFWNNWHCWRWNKVFDQKSKFNFVWNLILCPVFACDSWLFAHRQGHKKLSKNSIH